MMSALEKAKALREFRNLRTQLADSGLKPLEKAKALKRFRELRGLLGGGDAQAGAVPQAEPPQADAVDTSLLTGIISGQIDTFKDKAKLQELSDSLAKAGGDDMPAGEVRDLFEKAIRSAGVQVLAGFGYLDAAA